MDLPWKPIYTQSKGEFDWSGGISAANGATSDDEPFSPLAFWSLAGTVGFTLLVYLFEGNLDARQKRSYMLTSFPQELAQTVSRIDLQNKKEKSTSVTEKSNGDKKDVKDNDSKPKQVKSKDSIDKDKALLEQLQAKFKTSQEYGLDKINFGMIAGSYETLESIVILLTGLMPFFFDSSVRLGRLYLGMKGDEEIRISLIFLLLQTIFGTITGLPFEIYKTFYIEKKHGFNKQTYGLFFSDKIKSLILQCVIGGPFVALLLTIIKVSPLHVCTSPFV